MYIANNEFVIAYQNGTTIAPSSCSVAIQGLFGGNDTCSNIARQFTTSGGNISNGDMPDVACLARLLEFSTSCNMSLNVSNTISIWYYYLLTNYRLTAAGAL